MTRSAPLLRFTTTALLAATAALVATGLYGLVWPMPAWMYDLHRIAAWAFVALLPWKLAIAWGSLKRGFDRRFIRSGGILISLLLSAWTATVLGLGLLWAWRIGEERLWAYQTAISWHWYLALGLLVPLGYHAWQKWPRPRRADFTGRREAVRLLGVGAAGLALWGVSEMFGALRRDPDRGLQPSGSRETGSFTGLGYPVNHLIGEGKIRLDPATWRLELRGAVRTPMAFRYDELLARPAVERTVTLDCTDGWYTTQVWRGIPLKVLLQEAGLHPGAAGVILRAASGFAAVLALWEAEETLLATHSGGQPFDHGHGYPLRAVVPSRRGWQWVKWLVEVDVI